MTVDPDSFQHTAQLMCLSFAGTRPLVLMPDSLAGLTALARLTIRDGGLVSVPAALEALGGSLTRLALPWNDGLQLEHQDVVVLLTLRQLRTLDLRKSDLEDVVEQLEDLTDPDTADEAVQMVTDTVGCVPSVWSNRSLQHLMELPVSFLRSTVIRWLWRCTKKA